MLHAPFLQIPLKSAADSSSNGRSRLQQVLAEIRRPAPPSGQAISSTSLPAKSAVTESHAGNGNLEARPGSVTSLESKVQPSLSARSFESTVQPLSSKSNGRATLAGSTAVTKQSSESSGQRYYNVMW